MNKHSFLLLGLFVFFISCSKSDGETQKNQSNLNPPEWIHGTWLLGDSNPPSGFKFSQDDFCLVLVTGQNCFKESIRLTDNSGGLTHVTEDISNDSYSVEITLVSQIVTYKFKKHSETTIELLNDPLGDLTQTLYIKQ